MAQRITVKIAERDYIMNAPTPEMEEMMRLSAQSINKKIANYLAKYPGKSMVDILSFVALNESISNLIFQKKLDAVNAEAEALLKETESYLSNV